MTFSTRRLAALALAGAAFSASPALADRISHPTAVFAGLDKITGRIISFEAAINETVQFGSLQITPRVCYSRPATEAPQTDVFAEVEELGEKDATHRIFTGWMFAASPGLHGIEHPVYDIWLTDCKGGTQVQHIASDAAETPDSGPPPAAPDATAPTDPKAAATPAKKKKIKKVTPVDPSLQPLDLGAAPQDPGQPVARAAPTRRIEPADAPPVPPGDVPN